MSSWRSMVLATLSSGNIPGGFLDVLQLSSGGVLPGVKGLQGVIEVGQSGNKILNLSDGSLETSQDLKLLLDSLDLLGKTLLLVLGDGDAHGVVVVVDGVEESSNSIVRLLEDVLSLLKVSIGSLEVENLLHLLDFLLSELKISGDGLAVLSVANEGILCLGEKSESVSGLVLGVLPSILDPLDVGLQELGFVGVLEDDLTLSNEICDDVPLGVELGERLLLSLNELINILETRWGNVSGGGQHDSVKELNMGLQLVSVGVAFPVEIHHDSGLLDI